MVPATPRPALFFAHYLMTGDLAVSHLSKTAGAIFAVLEITDALGKREIQLIRAQDAIAAPPDTFVPRQVR